MIKDINWCVSLVLICANICISCHSITEDERRRLGLYFPKDALNYFEVIQQVLIDDEDRYFRSKRQSKEDIFLFFEAFRKTFSLRLYPYRKFQNRIKVNMISEKHVSYTSVPHLSRYKGELEENTNSEVHGFLRNKTFFGTIETETVTYHLEPMRRYLDESDQRILIYKASDLKGNDNHEMHSQLHCAQVDAPKLDNNSKYLDNFAVHNHSSKRSVKSSVGKYCTIHMVADYLYYQAIGRSSVAVVAEQFETMLGDATTTFSATDFNFDGTPDGITFYLVEITIFMSPSKTGFNKQETFKTEDEILNAIRVDFFYDFDGKIVGPDQVGVNAFFTHTSFGDVLGVTWGILGICSTLGRNILVVSSLSQGRTRTTLQMGHTLSHELGHMFGSPHDPLDVPACAPGGRFGDYLMSAYALDNQVTRNKRIFSRCSRESIAARLINRPNCLLKEILPVCGNQILDKGEECDCDDSKTCDKIDRCCTPSDLPNGCKFDRSKGKQCSPLYSPCCEANCKFTPASSRKTCTVSSECLQGSLCNGTSHICPMAKPSSNKYCMQQRMLCNNGSCKKSVCALIGKRRCNCKKDEHACKICCNYMNKTDHCSPFKPPDSIAKDFELPLYQIIGSRCHSIETSNGYCSSNNHCHSTSLKPRYDILNKPDSHAVAVIKSILYIIVISTVCFTIIRLMMDRYCTRRGTTISAKKLQELRAEAKSHRKMIHQQRINLENNFKLACYKSVHIQYYRGKYLDHRLRGLFPTVVYDIYKNTKKEIDAVRMLISLGYPIRRYRFSEGELATIGNIIREETSV